MKIYEIIFSPTGGTKKVADIISAGVGADSICIDLTDKDRSEERRVGKECM